MDFVSSDEEDLLTAREKLVKPYESKINDYFQNSKAPKTIDQYTRHVKRLKTWATKVGVSYLPLSVDDLLVYLVYLSETTSSFANVKMAKYAIKFAHSCEGFISPTDDPAVNLILEAARRFWSHPVKKARPMTVEIIKLLVDGILGQDVYRSPGQFKVSIADWRVVANIIVKFCFLCRSDDVVELKRSHFTFVRDLLYIHFPKAKNDQFHDGRTTLFEARKNKVYCPVFIVYKYFQRLGYKNNSDGYFLPKIKTLKVGRKYGKTIKVQVPNEKDHIGYQTCINDRRRVLNSLGLPGHEFTEHSDKAGGMSTIVNSGANLEDAQTHGRWKSIAVAHSYVQKSEKKKRELSRFFFKDD